ncbi:MAG TPA: cation:proton antiporter, partial [bacterium]|nr:cation:proton antiporter [bacterium]
MNAFWNSLLPSLLLLLLTARALGELSRRLGQPPLLGEMAAGILLGPALLGWVQGG